MNPKNLQHTYIVNCKDYYTAGQYLKVRITRFDIPTNQFELDCKDFIENPYIDIRKYLTEGGEYTGKVIAFPKNKSGIIVQLDKTRITCLVRVPSRFNSNPHYFDNVLIKVREINEKKKLIYGHLMRII